MVGTDLPFKKFREHINREFAQFKLPPVQTGNSECGGTGIQAPGPNSGFVLSKPQQFISSYYTSKRPNGLFIYHTVGAGKTLTAINLLKHFEKENFNILWVTRTTLRKDLDKGLLQLPLHGKLKRFSYKQFSNIAKKKGKNYHDLMAKAKKLSSSRGEKTDDPLYRTIVIIDEAHKLYTKDLKIQELHDIKAIEKMIFESYGINSVIPKINGIVPNKNRVRVVLMSATPITENIDEVLHLFNLIITDPKHRINVKSFVSDYIITNGKASGEFTDKGRHLFQEKIKDLVSYLNISKDPSKFAQVKFNNIFVPISEKPDLDTSISSCSESYKLRRSLGVNIDICKILREICKETVALNKEEVKGKYQKEMLLEKCNIDIMSL